MENAFLISCLFKGIYFLPKWELPLLLAHLVRLWLEIQRNRVRIRPLLMFVIEVVHIQCSKLLKDLECAVLFMVLYTIKNPWSHSIRVGHISDFGLPSVAILTWLYRKRRKAIFTHSLQVGLHAPYIISNAVGTGNKLKPALFDLLVARQKIVIDRYKTSQQIEKMLFSSITNVIALPCHGFWYIDYLKLF